MSDLLSIATIALAGIVQASLQLSLGGLVLLYHSSMGQHRRRKTRYLAKSYIWGALAISFLAVCAGAFLIDRIFQGTIAREAVFVIFGILLASAVVMWLLYYRRGKQTTQTWLPKSLTRYIARRAGNTRDNIEAFSLGMLSAFAELPLTLAIYAVAANCLVTTTQPFIALGVYLAIVAIPMVALKLRIKSGRNVAEVQRWRIRNKQFVRIISGGAFAVLAFFILTYWGL